MFVKPDGVRIMDDASLSLPCHIVHTGGGGIVLLLFDSSWSLPLLLLLLLLLLSTAMVAEMAINNAGGFLYSEICR